MFDKILNAFRYKNINLIAKHSTESATLNQNIIPKLNFKYISEYKEYFRADGIFISHTGSLLGYLFTKKPDYVMMGELSSFFLELGYPCHFLKTGVV